ncbi:hypothetical protein CFOL_v3_20611, partial [Cephalotus follicularis]
LEPYIPSICNHFDYMDIWRRTFLFQNSENRHSWFFCFDKTFIIDQTIPLWFEDWWLYYGPSENILLTTICEVLLFTHTLKTLNIIQLFCASSSNANYPGSCARITPLMNLKTLYIPTLQRVFWTKWWDNYDLNKCTSQTIIQLLQSKTKQSQQCTLTKSQIQTSIASSSTKQELQEQIKAL